MRDEPNDTIVRVCGTLFAAALFAFFLLGCTAAKPLDTIQFVPDRNCPKFDIFEVVGVNAETRKIQVFRVVVCSRLTNKSSHTASSSEQEDGETSNGTGVWRFGVERKP